MRKVSISESEGVIVEDKGSWVESVRSVAEDLGMPEL